MKIKRVKQRVLMLLLTCCLLLGAWPMSASAVDVDYVLYPTAGGYLRLNQFTGTLTDCANLSGDLVIPDTIEGVKVTSIADRAFYGCDQITSVTVPSSVQTIGDQAFTSCLALRTVTIKEGVTTLGKSAFRYCYSLTSVSLPSTLRAIDDYAFYKCIALPSVNVPVGVDRLGENAFADCEKLAQVTLPASVISIGEYCFSGCKALKAITLPTGISAVATAVFNGCSSLQEVIVPDGVQRIYGLAFRNCTSLRRLSLPNSVNSIGGNALDGCGDVTFYVNAGSYAQAFASANGIPFVLGTLNGGGNGNGGETKPPETYPETAFTDVSNHWAKSYIEWAAYHKYFNGETTTSFVPNKAMDRAMMVTVLYNIENRPATGNPTFSDVPQGKYYTAPVAWAASNGIVSGYEDNTFRPTAKISRQELATILYNYAKYKKVNTSATGNVTEFKDHNQIATYAGTSMSWAVGSGIIGGIGNGMLDPKGEATRAQGTVMLKKFMEL